MRWRKGFMVMLVLLTAVMVNVDYAFAAVTDTDPAVPDAVALLYEGNKLDESHNYYRLAVKYTAASGSIITVPKSLVIYQTYLPPAATKWEMEEEIHRTTFDSAGTPLTDGKEPSYLPQVNAFYYRNFTVKHNPKGTYKHRVVATWVNSSGKEFIRTSEITVEVTKEVSTQLLTVGTDNMFGRAAALSGFDKSFKYVPKKTDKQPGYDKTLDIREGNMDREWGKITGETTITVSVPDNQVFIANASLETHVVYTGDKPLPAGTKIKAYIKNPSAIDNSLEVGAKREIPALSAHLTELATAPHTDPSYSGPTYPKKLIEVYMGLGNGPQGDGSKGKYPNDVAFIFGNTAGSIHSNFEIHLEDEAGAKVLGFVFDYINLTYNPIIFTGGIKVADAGYVKPEGFLMVNTKFELGSLLPAVPTNEIVDASIRISLQNILDSELNDYAHFVNGDGTPFDGKSIGLTIDGINFKHIGPGITGPTYEYIETKDDKGKVIGKDIFIKNAGKIEPKLGYSVKMIIPTKRKLDGKKIEEYNDNIVGKLGDISKPGKRYPIKMEIIENNKLLIDSDDELVRYNVNFSINPYQMPGIN